MKTNNEVEPSEMNLSGSPVGGIEPLNISYCIIIFIHYFAIDFTLSFVLKLVFG